MHHRPKDDFMICRTHSKRDSCPPGRYASTREGLLSRPDLEAEHEIVSPVKLTWKLLIRGRSERSVKNIGGTSTYRIQPSHLPTLLPLRKSTNHVPLARSQSSVPISHIRLSRPPLTSSTSSCVSWEIDAMGSVACGRCTIKVEGDAVVNRKVCLRFG